MKQKSLILALLVLSVAGASFAPLAQAQQTGTPAPTAPPPSAPPPAGVAGVGDSALDQMGVGTYLLGPVDILEVRVLGEPQMSGNFEVDDQGKIELPFIDEPVPANCRTDRELRQIINDALRRYIRNPRVYVRVADRRSRPPAVVFGAVRVPSRFQMNRRVRLLELLAQTGGLTEQAGGTIQIFHTEPVRCAEQEAALDPLMALAAATAPQTTPAAAPANAQQTPPAATTPANSTAAPAAQTASAETANGETAASDDPLRLPFEVYSVADLRAGRESANPFIRPGDIVIVQDAPPVYITGAVVSPQGVYLRDHTSLTMAFARVGGIKREARASHVRIYRQRPGAMEPEILTVNYDEIRRGRRPDIQLQPYDIIEVPEAGFFSGPNLGRMLLGMATGGLQTMVTGLPMRVLY